MANVTYGDKVFGLRDVKVTNIGGTTQEDCGAATMFAAKPVMKSGMLEGDDAVKAVTSFITHAEGEISYGQISSAALALMMGITLTLSGTSPNEVTTLKVVAGQNMPYFKAYGKGLGEGIDDAHVLIYKAKLTELDAHKMENGNWFITKGKFLAVDDGTNGIYAIKQNETAATLPAS